MFANDWAKKVDIVLAYLIVGRDEHSCARLVTYETCFAGSLGDCPQVVFVWKLDVGHNAL